VWKPTVLRSLIQNHWLYDSLRPLETIPIFRNHLTLRHFTILTPANLLKPNFDPTIIIRRNLNYTKSQPKLLTSLNASHFERTPSLTIPAIYEIWGSFRVVPLFDIEIWQGLQRVHKKPQTVEIRLRYSHPQSNSYVQPHTSGVGWSAKIKQKKSTDMQQPCWGAVNVLVDWVKGCRR
jgi:hypothetical protein